MNLSLCINKENVFSQQKLRNTSTHRYLIYYELAHCAWLQSTKPCQALAPTIYAELQNTEPVLSDFSESLYICCCF